MLKIIIEKLETVDGNTVIQAVIEEPYLDREPVYSKLEQDKLDAFYVAHTQFEHLHLGSAHLSQGEGA